MKNIRYFLTLCITVVVFFLMSGCTQNNGNIGNLYGIWAMDNPGLENYFWRFQSDIVQISVNQENNEYDNFAGQYHREGNQLILNFTDLDPYFNIFLNPIGLQAGEITTLTIKKDSGSTLELMQVLPDGNIFNYYLRKLN